MASMTHGWRDQCHPTEPLEKLRIETLIYLQKTWSTSQSPDYGIMHTISEFAGHFLEWIKTEHVQADATGGTERVLPKFDYDGLKIALETVKTSSEAAALDLRGGERSEHIITLRDGLADVEALFKRADERKDDEISTAESGSGRPPVGTGEASGGTLEANLCCRPLAESYQRDSDARLEGHVEHASAKGRRPSTPQNLKRDRALLSPGSHYQSHPRPFKRSSCEDLSPVVNDMQQLFQHGDVGSGERQDCEVEDEEADELDSKGQAPSTGNSNRVIPIRKSVAGRWTGEQRPMVIFLPSQAAEGIVDDLNGLEALAPGEEAWHCCWVLKEEMESSSSDWRRLKELPGVHVIQTHTSVERIYYEIAICNPYRRKLLAHGFKLKGATIHPDDWTVPRDEVFQRHGQWHAEQMVADRADRYMECALKALESGRGPGLDDFYRRFAPLGLQTMVEWVIVMRRLMTAEEELFHRFAQCCVALGLSLLQDMEGPAAEELMLRDLASWREFFYSVRGDRLKWPPGGRTVELHDIAVLCYIMDYSGFERDAEPLQHCFDDTCSTEEKLDRLGFLLDIGVRPPIGSKEDIVSEAFSRAQVSEDGAWEAVRDLVSRLVPGFFEPRSAK